MAIGRTVASGQAEIGMTERRRAAQSFELVSCPAGTDRHLARLIDRESRCSMAELTGIIERRELAAFLRQTSLLAC